MKNFRQIDVNIGSVGEYRNFFNVILALVKDKYTFIYLLKILERYKIYFFQKKVKKEIIFFLKARGGGLTSVVQFFFD